VTDKTSGVLTKSVVINALACKSRRRDVRYYHENLNRQHALANRGRGFDLAFGAPFRVALIREVRVDVRRPWKLFTDREEWKGPVLDQVYDPPKYDEETGDLIVNRQQALTGTDVRVDNMAWNIKEETVVASHPYESMVWSKERELQMVREEAPLINLIRDVTLMTKKAGAVAPLDLRAVVLAKEGEEGWVKIGEVMKGSPFTGLLHAVYDPVALANKEKETGALAVSVKVDQT